MTLTIHSMQPAKYHYLRQSVTVSGLDTPFFDKVVAAVSEIYGVFDHVFTQGVLGSWVLTESHGLSLEASNRYFMPAKPGLCLESVPFQENVDPSGLLAEMLTSLGARCMHAEDNEVEYCMHTFYNNLGKNYVKRRFEACRPQSFRQGDIVELQLSFVVIPLKEDPKKGKQYKMLVVL
ncbi:hypothetical protein L208DRAFT_1236059 [Tricholoma matsutake]|nr:hypothetical protein L208DRAFT_1236059 [Tricholoma matsutake 945]